MSTVLRGSFILSLALLLGRISGFLRELLLAARFGVSEAADAAVLILTLPDLMVGVLLAGGFNAALVPALKKKNFAARQSLVFVVGGASFGFLSILALAFFAWPDAVIRAFAPELDITSENGIVSGFRVSLIAFPMAALIGVSISYLNTVGKFSYAGLSVLIFNITLCGFLIVPDFAKWGVLGFGVAIIAANLFRLTFQLGAMREIILTPLRYVEPVSLEFIRVFLYGIASYALVVGAAVVFRTIHASGGDGELAAFNYANKLFELPAALLVAPVATVFLPLLADNTQMGANEFEEKILAACGAAWALSFSSGVLGHQFMELIVGLIYGYGSMSDTGLESIASVAKIMVLALPAYALFQICSVALNAKMQTLRVFISTVFALMVGLGAAYFLSVFSVGNPAAYGFVSFLWSAAIMTLFCLQLRSQALANLARKLGGALVMISLVVLIPVALIDAFDDSSKLLSGLGFLVAACLCGLVSLRHIRPLRSIQISTT